MKRKSLIELNHAISTALRELTAAQSQLEHQLGVVEKAREAISTNRTRANSAFIDALGHFTNNPMDVSGEMYHGICRLAEDAGFDAIGEELRKLSANS